MRGIATGQADSPPYQLSARGATSRVDGNTPAAHRPFEPPVTTARQPLPQPSTPSTSPPPLLSPRMPSEWSDRRSEWLDAHWNILNSELRDLETGVRNRIRDAGPNTNWTREFSGNYDRETLFSLVLVCAVSELYTDHACFRGTLDEFRSVRRDAAAAEIGRFFSGVRWVEVPAFEEMRGADEERLGRVLLGVALESQVYRARRRWLMAEMEVVRHNEGGLAGS